jgi:hypothetical protein
VILSMRRKLPHVVPPSCFHRRPCVKLEVPLVTGHA